MHSYKTVPNRDSWTLDPSTENGVILPIVGYESVTICCQKTPGETSGNCFSEDVNAIFLHNFKKIRLYGLIEFNEGLLTAQKLLPAHKVPELKPVGGQGGTSLWLITKTGY